MELSVSTRNIHGKQDELSLFGHDIAIQVLHEFMGIIPDAAMSEENGRSVEGTILTLSRLDAFIATALTCLRDDGSDNVGGHRQKLYYDTFTTFLPLAYNQLISVVRQFVNEWCPTDFSLDALSIDSNGVPKDPLVEREGTIEIYIPSMQRRLIAVAWNWFNAYITPEMGTIHDCYIAEYDTATNCIRLLGTQE